MGGVPLGCRVTDQPQQMESVQTHNHSQLDRASNTGGRHSALCIQVVSQHLCLSPHRPCQRQSPRGVGG